MSNLGDFLFGNWGGSSKKSKKKHDKKDSKSKKDKDETHDRDQQRSSRSSRNHKAHPHRDAGRQSEGNKDNQSKSRTHKGRGNTSPTQDYSSFGTPITITKDLITSPSCPQHVRYAQSTKGQSRLGAASCSDGRTMI